MITCYLKPTDYCNVGCTHCYLPQAVRADRSLMGLDVLAATAALLGEMRDKGRHRGVHVLFHGGEPLTVPNAWYEAAFALLDRALPGHSESIQTSLIPLRADQLAMIKERFNAHVGSSIDFSQRQLKGSVEGYHRLWMQKVEMARAEGILVVPGVVPTTRELGREAFIVDWMMARGFVAFNIDRFNAYAAAFDDRPSNRQHAAFLAGLFDALMARLDADGWAPLTGVIRAAITGVLFGVGGDRWGGSCMNDFVVVGPNGDLNNCPDKQTVEAPFSNARDGWEAFARSRFRRKWVKHQRLDHKEPYCASCDYQAWCGSGCPITPNGAAHGEDECSGYRSFLDHVRRFTATDAGRALAVAYLEQERRNPAAAAATVYGGDQQGACTA